MPTTSDDALKVPVDRFVDELAPVLAQVAGRVSTVNAATLQRDVVLEAFNLATAFIDVDGLHTDDELLNLLVAFGPRLETVSQCRTLGDRVAPDWWRTRSTSSSHRRPSSRSWSASTVAS
ncbi:MAG: hypothetical protein E6G06_03080 [Actinobacteria bacterium]|nr:MAG: hypothetical protein E6G06_03080 [Actinomycetota bacterium]